MANNDNRTPDELMRQWEKLNSIRRQLVTQGLLRQDATPDEVIPALRKAIPPDMLSSLPAAKE